MPQNLICCRCKFQSFLTFWTSVFFNTLFFLPFRAVSRGVRVLWCQTVMSSVQGNTINIMATMSRLFGISRVRSESCSYLQGGVTHDGCTVIRTRKLWIVWDHTCISLNQLKGLWIYFNVFILFSIFNTLNKLRHSLWHKLILCQRWAGGTQTEVTDTYK